MKIYLAGGCFWGVQAYFDGIRAVEETKVCYVNGVTDETSYRELKETDHVETLELNFDEDKIKLDEILDLYFRIIDPFSINKQGNDRGRQYRTGIYSDDEKILEEVRKYLKEKQKKYEKTITVEAGILKNIVYAEDYHQKYLEKNPGGYCHINLSSVPEEYKK